VYALDRTARFFRHLLRARLLPGSPPDVASTNRSARVASAPPSSWIFSAERIRRHDVVPMPGLPHATLC